ncbi:ATP-dependent DNA helicase [Mycolicibacter minnesotensis]|uniref:DNA 3'-5' helicase n=1 Tax=Mycolicibacter minnesotensis TaxID=1118379 RepID=A0A7I7R350_9MYCO|nr:ATP-dependent DNA helicase [Mycolicibacter minnesotensis]ORA98291.1 ATP-dependent DNA helicase [Mycolicibacter minnesotensis]BBY32556.1 DNA helicase [Mycolicibacter minnesotensis]
MAQHWGPHTAQVAAVLDPLASGAVQVRGGPGTGKTSLLAQVATAHVADGVDANSVLLLTGAGRLPAVDRGTLTATLLAAGGPAAGQAIREPVVRSVHGYAFAVLQRAARRAEATPPRLVTGAEQDSVIRELLAGDGAGAWPPALHAALATDGFTTELRDLMARCAERGVDPAELIRLGKRCRRPEWTAAGRFARQYEQVMLLRAAVGTAAPQATTPALGAAELVGAALEAFATDPDLLLDERSRIRLLLVDDAQQLDPQAAQLVRVLAAGVHRTVIAGDPDQAVFGFRGAEPTVLLDRDGTPERATVPVVTLTTSHRCAPAVARAISAVARRLPGTSATRRLEGTGPDDGVVTVRTAPTAHAEAALIADTLRRARLIDSVPWSQMAVIVRSVPRAAARLPRSLAAAGIPVALPAGGGLLAQQPAVAALLTVLECTADKVDGPRALALLSGPIGRVDPISLRQLQRTLRRGPAGSSGSAHPGDRLAAALTGAPGELPAAHTRALHRVRAVLQAAARSHAGGRDPHHTLWQAWNRSGLQQRWLAAAERGGPSGAQASRDLDAVTALFDLAEQYVARTAGTTVTGLVEYVTSMQLPSPRTESALGTEAVAVLSAHAALGREWDLVVVAGVQEGLWPNTVPRGGVLGTQRLLDTLHGFGEEVSARAPLLAEERRLLVAALGRARRRLVITAVDGDGDGGADVQIPSEFVTELAACATGEDPRVPASPAVAPPVLSAAGLVGRLRAVVCAPEDVVTISERTDAARQLARLARAGVPGADPQSWYGATPLSTEEPLWRPGSGQVVTLSPSAVQSLLDCPLRWLAERHGGTDRPDLRSTIGSVVHALVAESGRSPQEMLAELDRAWQQLPFTSPWYSANEHDRHRAMIETFAAWRTQTRGELTEVGTEVSFDGVVDAGDGVRLRGRIDRVERDAAGRLVVVDVKTAKTPVSKDDAQQHAQLAVYQLAVEAGLIGADEQPGGGRLVYPAKPAGDGASEREQDALTAETGGQWRERIAQAAAATAGPQFAARVNDGCRHCPVRPVCPAHTRGCGA